MRRIIVVALTLTALGPSMLGAQRDGGKRVERPVPFKIGETLTYDVSWSSFITAGTAAATIKEKKASFDSTAYYIVAEGRPTPIVAKLYSFYYKLDTLLDSYTLLPQRGSVYSEEGGRRRFKVTRFDHAAHKAFFEYQSTGTAEKTFAEEASAWFTNASRQLVSIQMSGFRKKRYFPLACLAPKLQPPPKP